MNGNNHKRILLKLFVLALIWMSAPQAFAYSFQVNGIYYTRAGSSSSKVVMVSNRSSLGGDYSGDIVIPETVEYAGDTYSVQYVAQGAFINCPQLTSVELPNTIISIGQSAFKSCYTLKSVNIPSELTEISAYTFDGCISLYEVKGYKDSKVTTIRGYAFNGCSSLPYLPIPDATITIDAYAFQNAGTANIKDIDIPHKVKTIGSYAFSGIRPYSIEISENVRVIGDNAFLTPNCTTIVVSPENKLFDSRENCNAIIDTWTNRMILGCRTTTFPDGVESIAKYAFTGCTYLNTVNLPASVKTIEEGAFFNCEGLQNLTINGDITELETRCFYNSNISNLKLSNSIRRIRTEALAVQMDSLTLPLGLEYMAEYAVSSKSDMKCIVLPPNLEYMGSGALYLNGELTELRCMGDVPEYTADDAFTKIWPENVVLRVKPEYMEHYMETYPWSLFLDVRKWINVKSVTLNKTHVDLHVGGKTTLTAVVAPDSVSYGEVTWISSDESVVVVTDGVVTALSEGTAVIKAVPVDGSPVYGSCVVTVGHPITNVDALDLTDGDVYDSKDYRQVGSLTYTRDYTNTKWQALYVPFSMSYDDWKDDYTVATLNAVRMYDTDGDDVFDVTEVEIVKVKGGTLYPNHPYFIKSNTTGVQTISLSDVLVYPAAEESISCSTTEVDYVFKGTYSGVSGEDMVAHKYYALANGAFCYTTNTSSSLMSFRWYLDVIGKGSQIMFAPTSNSKVRLFVDGELENDDALAVESFADVDACSSERIYSVDGQLVSSNGDKSGLRPGIYIQGGIKFMVK